MEGYSNLMDFINKDTAIKSWADIESLFCKYSEHTKQYLVASAKFDKHHNAYLFLNLYITKGNYYDVIKFDYSNNNIQFAININNVHETINREINHYEEIALSLNLDLIIENSVMDIYDYYEAINEFIPPSNVPYIEE